MTSGPKRNRTSSKSPPPSTLRHQELTDGDKSESKKPNIWNKNYPLVQQKGQRRYGPPLDWVKEPPRGSEVHVSKLPKNLLEDELIPLFGNIGKIYELRLMMETSEINKGFAFIKFCSQKDSENAIRSLNKFEIRPNVRISVRKSLDNNRLFIGNVPKIYTAENVLHFMKEIFPGVVKVILYASVNDRTKNRGYGFVEFESHQQAKNARNKLKRKPVTWLGQEVKVDWAEPELEVDEETMKKVCIIYSL